MPTVKGKKFPYTKKGVAAAKKSAKKAGVKVKVAKKAVKTPKKRLMLHAKLARGMKVK